MHRLLKVAWILGVAFFIGAEATAHPSVSLVMDRAGNVYYSDLAHVWRISPDGSKAIVVRNVHTHELYLDASGNLFGEHLWYEGERIDKWGHYVWMRKPDGKVVTIIPRREGFLSNYSFVRDARGTMFWIDREAKTIMKRLADGRVLPHARSDFRNVGWMSSRPDGTLFLVDGPDLKRVAPSGAVATMGRDLRVRGSLLEFVPIGVNHNLMGVWSDDAGNAYVAVYGGRQVKRVTVDGTVTVIAKIRAPWSPAGGMFDPGGELWLLEYSSTNQVRVRHIRKNGQQTIY